MKERVFTNSSLVPRRLDEVFSFFSDARNLEVITPPRLRLRVATPGPIEMKPGAIIDYTLRVRGIPARWRTLITHWEPGKRFVDEQVKGPYRQWIHEHTFEATADGTVVKDTVRYIVPMDFLVHSWLVRPDIEKIFAYRSRVIAERFGGSASF